MHCLTIDKNGDNLNNCLLATFCYFVSLGFTLGDVNDAINIDYYVIILDVWAGPV